MSGRAEFLDQLAGEPSAEVWRAPSGGVTEQHNWALDVVDHGDNTNYVALAKDSNIHAVGRISRAGRSIVYVNGEVFDGQGNLLATGTSILKKVG